MQELSLTAKSVLPSFVYGIGDRTDRIGQMTQALNNEHVVGGKAMNMLMDYMEFLEIRIEELEERSEEV